MYARVCGPDGSNYPRVTIYDYITVRTLIQLFTEYREILANTIAVCYDAGQLIIF